MKVLFLCNVIPDKVGAFEEFVVALGSGFSLNRDRLVAAFTGPPIPAFAAKLTEAGVTWHIIPGWEAPGGVVRPWAVVGPALRLIRQEAPDVVAVHFGNELPTIVLICLSRLLRRRAMGWVWHQRQQVADPSPLVRQISRLKTLSLFCDHFVVSYEGGKRSLVMRGVPGDRVTAIYNAVRPAPAVSNPGWLRRSLGLSAKAVLVANVGWLVSRKRIDISIRAFVSVLKAIPHHDCHLVVVGEGPERTALEAVAGRLGVAHRVHFLGQRADVQDVLAECDVLIHSSIAETCTNVVLEAMAAGKPVVMTEAGAAREQIEEGVSGFVAGPNDIEGLGERLRLVLSDAALRERLGVEARRRWQRMFTLEISVHKHLKLYRTLSGR